MRETHTDTFVAMENVIVCTRRERVGVGDVGLYVENCKPSTLRSVHNLIGLVDSVRLHDSECLCEGGHVEVNFSGSKSCNVPKVTKSRKLSGIE